MENIKLNKAKIKRPRNAFIIYRQEKSANVNSKLTSILDASKILGHQWTNEPESVKEEYRKKAKYESDFHKIKYPEYVFTRRVSSTIIRRGSKVAKSPGVLASSVIQDKYQNVEGEK
jgi:hypothetical protein